MADFAKFRRLHESGCFVIPNPWDAGSARLLEGLGFEALATTSAGVAWSLGMHDNHVPLDDALKRIETICASVRVPVNADFEGGFAIDPADVDLEHEPSPLLPCLRAYCPYSPLATTAFLAGTQAPRFDRGQAGDPFRISH